jgi:hypothetical protein
MVWEQYQAEKLRCDTSNVRNLGQWIQIDAKSYKIMEHRGPGATSKWDSTTFGKVVF